MLRDTLKYLPPIFEQFDIAFFGALGDKGCNSVVITKQIEFGYKPAETFHFISQQGVGVHALQISVINGQKLCFFKRLDIITGRLSG